MSAVSDLDGVLAHEISRLDDVSGTIWYSLEAWTEAARLLADALDGTQDPDITHALAQFGTIAGSISHAAQLVAASKGHLEGYRASLDIDGDGSTRSTPPAPTRPPTTKPPPEQPLPYDLEEHLFKGRVVRRQISGYHHRPGGKDHGQFWAENLSLPTQNGLYEGDVLGHNSEGDRRVKKTMSAFFPDSWSTDDVRQAVRAAFADRYQPLGDNGTIRHPSLWEGTYRDIRVRGYVRKGTDPKTATLDDVTTIFPILDDDPKREHS